MHGHFMASFHVESLFTNIPLEETIKICCDSLYKNQELLCNISKNQFEKLLRATLGVAMGSPLGPSLANAFLAHYEQIWLSDCPVYKFNPVY